MTLRYRASKDRAPETAGCSGQDDRSSCECASLLALLLDVGGPVADDGKRRCFALIHQGVEQEFVAALADRVREYVLGRDFSGTFQQSRPLALPAIARESNW
jgi:hypothetical protein